LRAGFAKVPITPPDGVRLTGYAARQGVSIGVHDDLFARAMVLENGVESLAMISVDVLALATEFVKRVRQRISARTGIKPESILIAATHTHSGPVTIRTFFNNDETPEAAYIDHLASAIEQSVAQAWRDRFAARIATGAVQVENVGVNRSDPTRAIDREAGILRVDDAAGRVRGVVVQYGCHPTLLGFDNLLVTRDYPGMALDAIEESLGDGSLGMFFNGAEGNISVNHSSELNAIGVATTDRTFTRAREVGRRLASAVLRVLPVLTPDHAAQLGVINWPLELGGREYPDHLEERLGAARLRAAELAGGDEALLRKAKAEELYASVACANARILQELGGRVPFPLQGLNIGDTLFLGVPGELFSETGLALKRSIRQRLFLIGLANGYYGYVPTEQAFAEGSYESGVAFCAPDSEQRVLAAATELERCFSATGREVTR
jgi:neutral ceramidase